MSAPIATGPGIRRLRHRTGAVLAATAVVVAGAAFLTPKREQRVTTTRFPDASTQTALLSARPLSSHVLAGDSETFVAITMKAPAMKLARRAPASVAIVLDTSGSMGDERRLEDAKLAATSLVDRLGPDDELALVTYSTAAELILPLSAATDDVRGQARRAIASLQPAGGTNISGGLGLGADALAGARTPLRRVVLISDGEPTEGLGAGPVVDARPLVAFATRRASDGASITTVGVGLTFREDIMAGIATAGRGNYYFVERAADLPAMFARELGRLGETVVTGGELALVPGDGVEIVEAIGLSRAAIGGGEWRVPVADLRAGEQRKVVLRVRVRAGGARQELVTARWRFRTVAGEAEPQEARAVVGVTDDPAVVERGLDRVALELVEQARTAQALEQASAAFATDDRVEAARILRDRRAAMQAVAGELDDELVRRIEEATGRAERGFAEAPAAAAPEGMRAMKDTSTQVFELAH